MKTLTSLLSVLAAATVLPAAAQNTASGNAGQQIANSGAGNGVAACASCHGAKGEGNAAANFPRIAGQSQAYLEHQLESFANGSRSNPVMTPIAKGLNKQQIEAVSAYYATLAAPASTPASAQPASQRGRTLATVGDSKIDVQACANCHGPGGSGEAPTYPYLGGQHANYLKAALQAWKNGSRNNDPTGQMQTIAKRLSDGDIDALAGYYAAQPAPAPAGTRVVVPMAGTAQR